MYRNLVLKYYTSTIYGVWRYLKIYFQLTRKRLQVEVAFRL